MTSKRIVITSDLHLDAWTAGVERFDDIEKIFSVIVAAAVNVDEFVFVGDLCDPDSSSVHRCIDAFARGLRQLESAKTGVTIIPGNHDVLEDGTGTTIYDGLAHWIRVAREPGPILGRIGRRPIGFALPFVPRARAYDPAEVVATHRGMAPLIVFGHLNAKGVVAGSESSDFLRGRDVFWPLEELERRWPKAELVGGHYHKPQDGRPRIIGAPAVLTFGEEGNEPRYLLAEVGEDSVKIESIPIVQPRKVVTVRTVDEAEAIEQGALVRVCSADERVRQSAAPRSLSVVPGPIAAEPTAVAAVGGELEFEEMARELAGSWPFEDEMRSALVEVVGAVLEESRAA